MKKLIVIAIVVFALASFAVKAATNYANEIKEQRQVALEEIH